MNDAEEKPAGHTCSHCHGHAHEHDHEHVEVQEITAETFAQASENRALYRIPNMDCPMEEALIRKRLASVPGVLNLQFNLMQRVLTVDLKPGSAEEVEKALKSIDMIPERLSGPQSGKILPGQSTDWKKHGLGLTLAILSELCELMADWAARPFGLDLPAITIADWPVMKILALALALWAIFLAGAGTFRKGWLALKNLNLNINALMAVAVSGAVLIGQFPEAAMVMVLFNISEAIEAKALDHARNAIKDLLDLAPKLATAQMADGSWREMNPAEIKIGNLVRVRPGEKIALDGIVTSGQSAVNQAPITGESMPCDKKPGDPVYAGTLNETGSLEYRTTATANDTTLARIIHAVEEAQATRAPMQRFVDVFAKYYTPAVFLLALGWCLLAPVLSDASWHQSIYTALVILVIGCPCALVISTPVTVVSGMAAATRKGILIKGGLYLEQGRKLNCLALDKTGTITWGKPELASVLTVDGFPEEKARLIGASLASRSDHPVSRALTHAVKDKNLLEIDSFEALPGKGIKGKIDNADWYLGNYSLAQSLGLASDALRERMENLEREGQTVVSLAGPDGIVAFFAVSDSVKPSSIEAIGELQRLGVRSIMLTGDNEYAAKAIAGKTGVNEVHASLLPEQKLELIEKLGKAGNHVGMVGDGINDAPALAKANIGFAMAAGGTDTAIETADVALMDDDLRKVPRFIRLSRSTHAILVENIAFALGIKAIFFALTLSGLATMWMAVFADVGAALIVVANGLRLMRK